MVPLCVLDIQWDRRCPKGRMSRLVSSASRPFVAALTVWQTASGWQGSETRREPLGWAGARPPESTELAAPLLSPWPPFSLQT